MKGNGRTTLLQPVVVAGVELLSCKSSKLKSRCLRNQNLRAWVVLLVDCISNQNVHDYVEIAGGATQLGGEWQEWRPAPLPCHLCSCLGFPAAPTVSRESRKHPCWCMSPSW